MKTPEIYNELHSLMLHLGYVDEANRLEANMQATERRYSVDYYVI